VNGSYIIYACPFREPKASHELLLQATRLFTGIDRGTPSLMNTPEGKPYFPEYPAVCFSLTHSGTWWIVRFRGRAGSGLDLQQHQRCSRERIAERYFHPDEKAFLQQGGYDAFFDVWAAKESFLKYTVQGMHRPMSDFSVVSGNALAGETKGASLRFLSFLPDYSLCLCAAGIGEVRIVQNWNLILPPSFCSAKEFLTSMASLAVSGRKKLLDFKAPGISLLGSLTARGSAERVPSFVYCRKIGFFDKLKRAAAWDYHVPRAAALFILLFHKRMDNSIKQILRP
jgi:phosphopantetheinyl transferase